MNKQKAKRIAVTAAIVIACYLLQCTLFQYLALASIKPNLILILTASIGFMRGSKEGCIIGFFGGLMMDVQFGNILGFYALLYLLIGFGNGVFHQIYYDEDIKLPILLISSTEFLYGLCIYLLMYMLRSEFDFINYLGNIIIPELIYTVVAALVIYPLLLLINRKFEAEEKRSANKFV